MDSTASKKKRRSLYTRPSKWIAAAVAFALCAAVTLSAWNVAAASQREELLIPESFVEASALVKRTTFVPNLDKVFLEGSSVELDLGVTVFLENGDIAIGCPFEFQITPDADPEAVITAVDDDLDGQIYIEGIEEGDYQVAMVEMEGITPPDPVTVTVQPKVLYQKVDVSDKIVKASEIDTSKEDSKYGGGRNTNGGTSAPAYTPPTDTVEYVESSRTTKQVTEEKPVLDSAGNQMIKYTPILGANGCLLLAGGTQTDLIPETDADGYLKSVKRLVSGSAVGGAEDPGGGEQPPGGGEQPPKPVYEDVTSLVLDSTGRAVTDSAGNPVYQLTAFPQVTTVTTDVITYYGWQTIDGKTYYYDKTGKYVTGHHVIQGAEYYFDANGVRGTSTTPGGGKIIGIDVSTWQGNIDWVKVRASGVEFAIIRLGFRGYSSGKLVLDDTFHQNMRGAAAAGIKIGVYFFTQAINEAEAVEEASMCLQMVRGYSLQYPIFIDIEDSGSSSGRANGLNNAQRTKICIAFCETIRSGGYRAGIYANKYYLTSLLNTSQFSSAYVIWLAHYVTQSSYAGRYEMWQHTSVGKVNGISGNVDMNVSYVNY